MWLIYRHFEPSYRWCRHHGGHRWMAGITGGGTLPAFSSADTVPPHIYHVCCSQWIGSGTGGLTAIQHDDVDHTKFLQKLCHLLDSCHADTQIWCF